MAETATQTLNATVEQPGAGHEVFPPFDTTNYPSQLLWLAISFGLLFLLLSKVVLPKFSSLLEDRRNRIANDLKQAHQFKAETDAAVAAYEAALAEARKKAGTIAAETRDKVKADVDARQKVEDAKFASQLAAAEAQIAAAKTEGLSQVGEIASQTARAIVSRLSGLDIADSEISAKLG